MRTREAPKVLHEEDMDRMLLPADFREAKLASIQDDAVREVVRAYIHDIHENMDAGRGLLIWGDNGRGKTSAAAVMGKAARSVRATVLFVTVQRLIQSAISHDLFDTDGITLMERARIVEMLILDDMGKEHASDKTAWAEGQLEGLLRERCANRLVTIATTNLTFAQLNERYKKSMFEVLKGKMGVVRFDGANLRDEKASDLGRRMTKKGT